MHAMPPASSLRRLAGALAVLCIVVAVVLAGRPSFTNASRPPRGVPDPVVAIEVAQSIGDVDDILGDAPSPDREVMRVKQYIDFGFIAAYLPLFLTLAMLLSRQPGWPRAAGMAALVCAVATAAFDVRENLSILRILDVPLRSTSAAMINAIRGASAAKWALVAVTEALLAALFLSFSGWPMRAIGALIAASAAGVAYGFDDPRFLVWQSYPTFLALLGVAALWCRWR